MCVIITTPNRGFRPSLRQLELCELANGHGSGLAWLDGDTVEYRKSLDASEISRRLAEIHGPAIVHFRIASVGGVTPELCHPFPVTHRAELRSRGRARSVLFHNGTWSEHRAAAAHFGLAFPKREPVSDTRVAASLVARFGFDWLQRADHCRWALLSRDGIRRIGHWQKLGGCHYSNTYWMPSKSAASYDWAEGFLFEPEPDDDDAPAQ